MISRNGFFGRGRHRSFSTPINLNPREARAYTLNATGTVTASLPDARTLQTGGPIFVLFCVGGTVQVRDAAGGLGATLTIGKVFEVYLADNSTLAGTWMGRIRTIAAGSGVLQASRLFLVGGNGANLSSSVYTPAAGTWAAGLPAANPKLESAAFRVGGRTFVCGFYPSTAGVSNKADELNATTGAWTNRTDLPFNVSRTCAAGSQRRSYGEVYGGDTLTNVFLGVPFGGAATPASTNFLVWSGRRALPILKSRCTAVALEGLDRVIILGGDPVPTPNLAHSVGLDTYWTIANMPTAFRHSISAFVCNGLVYACGGRSETPTTRYQNVDEYNPLTDSWASVAPLVVGARYGGAAIGGNQRGYYVGGQDNADVVTNSTVSYLKDTWTTLATLDVPRATCANHGSAMA